MKKLKSRITLILHVKNGQMVMWNGQVKLLKTIIVAIVKNMGEQGAVAKGLKGLKTDLKRDLGARQVLSFES